MFRQDTAIKGSRLLQFHLLCAFPQHFAACKRQQSRLTYKPHLNFLNIGSNQLWLNLTNTPQGARIPQYMPTNLAIKNKTCVVNPMPREKVQVGQDQSMLATCTFRKQDEILTLNRKGSRETLRLSTQSITRSGKSSTWAESYSLPTSKDRAAGWSRKHFNAQDLSATTAGTVWISRQKMRRLVGFVWK